MQPRPVPHLCFYGIAPTVGDTAIGQSILQGLQARLGLPVRVYTTHPQTFAALPEVRDCDTVLPGTPRLAVPGPRSAGLPARLYRLLADLRATGGANRLPPPVHAGLRQALQGCAGVVIQGGPTWNDRWINRGQAVERWLFAEAAAHFGAGIYQVGVSCGPFAWPYPRRLWMRRLCRAALDRHDILFLRDRFSGPAVARLGCTRVETVASTDAAVFLQPAADVRYAGIEACVAAASARPRLAVCVRDFQPHYRQASRVKAAVMPALARVLDDVQRDLADVFFIGTDHAPGGGKRSDLEVARAVQAMMAVPGSVVVEREVANPAALKRLYGLFDAMLSMRLHPTILALDHGVPCLILSYDAKCDDFFAGLGLGEYAVPVGALEPAAAVARLAEMLRGGPLRADIRRRFAALKAEHAGDWRPMYARIARRVDELFRAGNGRPPPPASAGPD